MKNKLNIFLLFFLTCNLFCQELLSSKYFSISLEVFDLYNSNGIYTSPENYMEKLDQEFEFVSDFLKVENWLSQYDEKYERISLKYTKRGPSHVEGGYNAPLLRNPSIYLNNTVSFGFAPIQHEFTHLLLLDYNSLSIREGLANYIQEDICNNPTVFSMGYPIHSIANQIIESSQQKDILLDVIGMEGHFEKNVTKGNLRDEFYNLSYSFTKYLIEEYGIEKLLKIYDAKELNDTIMDVYQKDIKSLKNEWLLYIEDFEIFEEPYEDWVEERRLDIVNEIAGQRM